ncbi:DUF3237 domain-containing protein [Novosphingobium cyanobacteriorum]|uniref:UPF0311 protein POM99_00545 n=1 Tax=Novosphingobium cyanobacteriorum TaxID=3024215 RepID=A0ABT6CCL8_9SPHN|nr:DUF3237 domain-containing protein [Novosphingobium cyanobacteriorum]MDF8331676.1 DUF3237 domain-containing protein [Novosphingobium cyanobacteriorum]
MTIALTHATDLIVELSPPHEMGDCPAGTRRIIPITGGSASGPLLSGRILPIGADWQTVLKGGIADLDARYAIETPDGAVIEVISEGIRHAPAQVHARIAAGEQVDPAEYYMRTAIRLETGHPAYDWVNRALFLARGGKVGNTVRLAVYRVD